MSDQHFIQSVYQILALLEIDPSRWEINYEHPSGDGRVVMALPDTKVALTTEGDTPQPFVEDGWYLSTLSVSQMQTLHTIFSPLATMAFEDKRRGTMNAHKATSQHEQWLIDAVLRRGLPTPDRNHRIERANGTELTTPDLAWPDLKIAFFVDGLWWHVTRDDTEMIEALSSDEENRDALIQSNRNRTEQDGEIRSQMQEDGWVVLSCTDRKLEELKGINEQVDRIERVMNRLQEERKVTSERPDIAREIGDLL